MALLKIVLSAVILLVCSCTATHQQYVSAEAVRSCTSACNQQLSHCRQVCSDDCKSCDIQAKQETGKHYARYKHERCIEGKVLIRRLQSYHDPLQCRKMSCDCMADYRVCAQSCHGKIDKQIQVEKSCC